MKRATIGTDPEFFLRRGENLVASIPYIKGTKDEPEPMAHGGGLQKDNVAIEFATPPAVDGKDFVKKIGEALQDIHDLIPKDLDIVAEPSGNFPEAELQSEEAQQFGCSPDYNAWSMTVNEAPTPPESTFRSCGGHIHLGHAEGDGNEFLHELEGKVMTVKMMDAFHGIISTVLDNSPAAIKRRTLYGKAGAHRPTEYGVEYRTLSNYWMKSPFLVMLMDSLAMDVLTHIRSGKAQAILDEIGENEVVNIINDGKADDAKKVIDTILWDYMSEDSKLYYSECLSKINTFNLKKEWAISC
jgi:hypothetical protein